jgi:hypothetical protein
LENLVETGYNVPDFLVKGLEVTAKMIGQKALKEIPSDELKEITIDTLRELSNNKGEDNGE